MTFSNEPTRKMTISNECDNPNDVVSSHSLSDEATTVKQRQFTTTPTGTLKLSPSYTPLLPILPFDLVPEILCRLPVKLLLQLRCVCKSWNSLISNGKFPEKHLSMSKGSQDLHHIIISTPRDSFDILLWDSPIPSIFSALSTSSSVTQTQLDCPVVLNNIRVSALRFCSCDGILCFTIENHFPLLWNPSIRRFNTFAPLKYPRRGNIFLSSTFSFGYNPSTHNYKIVAVSFFENQYRVSIYTLGTDTWRRIQDFPYSDISDSSDFSDNPGVFVSGTINWLSYNISSGFLNAIVSLDLENESYQNLLLPDTKKHRWTLGKLRDCLCIFTSSSSDMLVEVWIMKEYGNKEPWTKLYNIPCLGNRVFYPNPKSRCYSILEDDQVLMNFQEFLTLKLFVYDYKNGTFNTCKFKNRSSWLDPEVYVESLISPCS